MTKFDFILKDTNEHYFYVGEDEKINIFEDDDDDDLFITTEDSARNDISYELAYSDLFKQGKIMLKKPLNSWGSNRSVLDEYKEEASRLIEAYKERLILVSKTEIEDEPEIIPVLNLDDDDENEDVLDF